MERMCGVSNSNGLLVFFLYPKRPCTVEHFGRSCGVKQNLDPGRENVCRCCWYRRRDSSQEIQISQEDRKKRKENSRSSSDRDKEKIFFRKFGGLKNDADSRRNPAMFPLSYMNGCSKCSMMGQVSHIVDGTEHE